MKNRKRIIWMLLGLLICLSCTSAWAEEEKTTLTWEELSSWAESYLLRAMNETPLNDPTEPEALTEDGYAFIYDFATLYMSRPELGSDSVLKGLVVIDEDQQGPRGVPMDADSSQVLSAFYHENPELEGTWDFAALYVIDSMPAGAAWAWVQRNGQRLETIQYAVHTPKDGAYTDAGVVFTLQADMVSAIRAYGLDRRITEQEVRETMAEVKEVMAADEYRQVPTSRDGSQLTPFLEEDLIFSGINLLHTTPAEAAERFGEAEETWMENGGEGWLLTLRFQDCVLTYACDAGRENPQLVSMTIDSDLLEGPRGIRLGDTLSSVLNRFRNGEGAYDEETGTELLYTMDGGRGTAEYRADASAVLRYELEEEDRLVTLYVFLDMYYVNEIILRIE